VTPRQAVVVAVGWLAACAGSTLLHRIERTSRTAGTVEVRMPWALQPFPDSPAPVYFRIINSGAATDTLDSVTSPDAGMAMLHGTSAAGAMTMMADFPIPAHDTIILRPGVLHVMLDSLHRKVVRGDSIVVTLHFRHAGEVTLAAPVISYDDLDKWADVLK
jgi:periplasmic copper chaperone A